MQAFRFILDVTRSCNKHYLPSKTQGHTVISTCTRARQKFDFFAPKVFSLIVHISIRRIMTSC